MSNAYEKTYDALCTHVRQTAMLQSIGSTLEWDERTYMPPAAGEYRAEQITCLAGMIHARKTDKQIGAWLEELSDSPLTRDPHADAGTTIRQLRREYDKQSKLPQKLVEELARATILGQQRWVEARKNNDFAAFAPTLSHLYDLKRQQAAAYGHDGTAYDALLDDFEPGAKTADIAKVLAGLRDELVPLVAEIGGSSRRPDIDLLTRRYSIAAQEAFGKQAAAAIGFDFQRGRLDVTHHPFCTELGPQDCRITTRYDEHHFPGAFFGILHEAGHGIYDQGLRGELYGLPPGAFVSLGIHESQSRLWENHVGRSRPFWSHFFPAAQQAFPEALGGVALDDFYFAINDVRPSLIRVEADEATYNLHIIVRFELEQALLRDDLKIADLPAAWNDKYEQYLGIRPDKDANGVLQDVHWSAGLVGYFPTYSLGNLYASQLMEAADRDLGGLEPQIAAGEFAPLRHWLNEKIHQPGQCYEAAELARRATGQDLSHDALIGYLRRKLEPLYGIG